jgi:hypothetical protein
VYIPSHFIAFEYQGEQHYVSSTMYGSASKRQKADHIKMDLAKSVGITLIPIPFWWDRSLQSLAATIRLYKPDISWPDIPSTTTPISEEMPLKYHRKFQYKPSVAQEYSEQIDPTGWYQYKIALLNDP